MQIHAPPLFKFERVIIMLDFDGLQIVIAGILYLVVISLYILKKKPIVDCFILTVFYVYVVGVIAITIFPIPIHDNVLEILREGNIEPPNNWVPFESISQMLTNASTQVATKQILGNLLLFLPFGFLLPLLGGRVIKAYQVLGLGLVASFLIEGFQQLIGLIINFNYRVFDIDDCLINTFGTILGYMLFRLALPLLQQIKPLGYPDRKNTLRE
ncbi:hypothetical protein CBW65_09920 [Tumebacillus avium]|uniref:VanZ-like domain-containing protein n=1 Tax=Tumebacillus avium TaxID=1903704 RepID=A0A1Y0IPM6_9BACL|nr:VanZ family protein [Tumebacillus avium]ARU61274.1 hypothetical protein CBW65_09920 [Tumebacillus avium]